MTSFTCSCKQGSLLYSSLCLGMQTYSTGQWNCTDDDHGNVCQNFYISGLVYVINIPQQSSLLTHLIMTIALTWTIKAVTPHSNITTMRTIFWIGVSQTAWCLERCFSAITGYLLKQDGSSSLSILRTANGWSKHKNSCEDKIKQCVTQPATSQFSCFYTTTSLSLIKRLHFSSTSPNSISNQMMV